jgi:SAM-dependent methyltransferase
VSLIALVACAPLSQAPGPGLQQGDLERIQRECLRAYSAELLAPMASGAEEIPAQVEADPKTQMQFLDKELTLDKGLFYPSLLEELLPAFEAYVTPGVRFLDLGSGDGRAVFLAAALGAKATGIEYDGELVEVSRRALDALVEFVDPRRVRFIQRDFFEVSWSRYELIFYFDQSSHEQDRVREKLRRELAPGGRLIVSHEQQPFPGLLVETAFPNLKVYCRPAAGAGCAGR